MIITKRAIRSVVIVAIPEDDDPVHKASSEAGAHMTMAFLGDSDPSLDRRVECAVAAFAANQPPFVLPATGRALLGDDKADVLMLDGSAVVRRRQALVQSPAVALAMEGTEQYPTWTPHVTLGYPESPAPAVGQPAQVRFDKIGFWTDDYDGPTYFLGDWRNAIYQKYLCDEFSSPNIF